MCARRGRKSFLIEDLLRPAPPAPSVPREQPPQEQRVSYPVVPRAVRAGDAGVAGVAGGAAWTDPRLCWPPMMSPYAAAYRQAYSFEPGLWWPGPDSRASLPRRAGGQVRFTAAQAAALERRFLATRYLSADQRRRLASELRLTDRQVKTWFQNRRAKCRRVAPAPPAPSPPPPPPPPPRGDGGDQQTSHSGTPGYGHS
ncbi:hypothetical protein JYU34_004849 [Plutella xylostella]|uniref:Homeobox protein Nkx-2.5 n=1 Tax=Plutella xylostella TaxID=51655 RepID=A0ABQ7QVE8_PLUXY|nr:hypothetical protein JYU34_004849 [Plutella xylostella]